MRNIEQLVDMRPSEHTSSQRPESTQQSEKRTLSAPVRPRHNRVHPRFNLKGDRFYEYIPIWSYYRYLVEDDDILVSLLGDSFVHLVEVLENLFLDVDVFLFVVDHLGSLELSILQILQSFF